jgi:hypothetical protein
MLAVAGLSHDDAKSQDDQSSNKSSTDSEEETLPYPYNKLPEDRWKELKKHLKQVNDLLHEAGNELSEKEKQELKSTVTI